MHLFCCWKQAGNEVKLGFGSLEVLKECCAESSMAWSLLILPRNKKVNQSGAFVFTNID